MAANEIKIHLATYLKDVGIKATSQQIDQLAKKLKTVNQQAAAGANGLEGALGKLPGKLGRIQGAIGGIGGQAMAVIGAFKVGWDIGTWINEKIVRPLFGIKDPIEELKKHNRQLKREAEAAAKAWDAALTKWEADWDKVTYGADKARQKIEDVTAAYLRMQQAKEKVQGAQDDATMLGLQRDKFNDMANAGDETRAAQVGKYYDVLIAEEKQKQQIAKFDREAEVQAQKQWNAEEALLKAQDKRNALKRQMVELDEKLDKLESGELEGRLGIAGNEAEERKVAAKKVALQAKLDAAQRDVDKRMAEKDAVDVEMTANAQARKNLQDQAELEVDERKKAYDDYCAQVEAQEAKAAQEAWQREQEEIRKRVELERQERTRMEQQLAQQRIEDLKDQITAEESAHSDALARQSAAGGKLSQAWSWYRNQDSMQSAIDEQKAQAAAEIQWEKDFARLKAFRKDWRTADFGSLSAADESVRQVALAKEEKEAADKAVIETAENTRELADKLDELLQVKG